MSDHIPFTRLVVFEDGPWQGQEMVIGDRPQPKKIVVTAPDLKATAKPNDPMATRQGTYIQKENTNQRYIWKGWDNEI